MKAYEQVLALEPDNTQAIDYLRQMYEKRRDWEKLLGLQRREAERLPPGSERAAKFLEIAKLATERVKKPEVCIELWKEVLSSDPENTEALGALAQLYERSKDFDALVSVLERQAEITYDTTAKVAILTKLGTLYGDRLNNDEGAVAAWRQVISLDPNDRKAQEALKKKYLALGRWDDLEVFYAESGKWDEFIRVLEQQEAKETSSEAKIGLLFKVAELWADKKQKSDRAAKAYEKVLELEPQNLQAAEALIPIYTAAGNGKSLANAIEVKLGHEQDPNAKLALLREVAALYEGKVKEPQKAFDRYQTAFEIAASDEQTALDMERAARQQARPAAGSAWSSRTTRPSRTAEKESDSSLAVQLRLRLGRVLTDELQRVDDALTAYRAVYEAEGENAEAISALERLYRQTGRFKELLGIYEKQRDLEGDNQARRAIQYQIAKLQETELGNVDEAIATYNAVLEDEPGDAPALAALDVLYKQLERWQPYADVLRKRIDLDLGEKELVDLKYRLGQTLEQHLGDAAGALENYREILFLDAQHEGARLALEKLLQQDELRAEAASILEHIYEERGDWEKLIGALRILSASEGDVARRVQLQRKIARIASEQLEDFTRAFDALAEGLKDDPAHEETRAEIERTSQVSESWPRLVELYMTIAAGLTDAVLAHSYWMRLGAIDEQLGDIDAAAAAYNKVLGLDPADPAAIGSLEALFTRTERWTDLISVVEKRVEQTQDATAREALYVQMAEIADARLGKPTDAVAHYRKVLELDPASQRALSSLDALFTRQKMWSELADNLEAQLALATADEEQLGLMLRLAQLRETEMNMVDTAIEGYRSVLERDPNNPQAFAALERLGQDARYELTIADLLEPLYRQVGDWQKLVAAHEVQVRRSEEPARRVELLHQIASLYEDAAGDLDSAFATLARALREEPGNELTQQQIDRVARATGHFAELAQVFEELAQKSGRSDAVVRALHVERARLRERSAAGGHRDRPLPQGAGDRPGEPAGGRVARAALPHDRRVRRAVEDPPVEGGDRRRAEGQEGGALPGGGHRGRRPREAGGGDRRLPEGARPRRGRRPRARCAHQALPRAVDLGRAARGLRQEGGPGRRSGREEADLVPGRRGLRARARRRPQGDRHLPEDPRARSGRPAGALASRRPLRAGAELDRAPLRAHARERDDRRSRTRRPASATASPSCTRSGSTTCRGRSSCIAICSCSSTITSRPWPPSKGSSRGRRIRSAPPRCSSRCTRPAATGRGSSASTRCRSSTGPTRSRRWSCCTASPVSTRTRSATMRPRSTPLRARWCSTTATPDTLTNLERLGSIVNRWPEVARLYDIELDKLDDTPERFVDLGLRVANLYEVQLEDVGSAIGRFKRVAEVDAENQQAIKSLDRLYLQTEQWGELAKVLAREAEIGQSGEEILELRYRLGQVQQTRLNDLDAAIAAYRDVLATAPDHAATLAAMEALFASGVKQVEIAEILEPLYRAASEWEKLAGVYEAQLAHLPQVAAGKGVAESAVEAARDERLLHYYKIAELYEEKILDVVTALDVYIRALKEFPLDERAGDDAPRLAAAIDGGWEVLANAYADILGLHAEPSTQAAVGKKLAHTFEDELGDVGKAEETYKYVLSVDPLDVDALANLDRIYSSLESWAELANILEWRIKAATASGTAAAADPLELVEFHARLGAVYETHLAQTSDAIRVFRAIFDGLDPAHEGAIAALARIYEGQQAWTELNTVYARELENASGDVAEAEIRAKIAHLAAERLNDPQKAIDTWKVVLDLRGEDPEALGGLANLYEGQSEWRELTDVLERQFDIATVDDERVNILTRRARVFSDKLQRDELALTDWNRVLDIDYANLAALRSLANIRRRQADAPELVAALHQTVDRASAMLDAEELTEIFRELGKTYGEKLEQPFDAAEAWRKLLEITPDFEAMKALEAIYTNEERWTDVVDVRMMRAEALTEPSAKIEELRGVAQMWVDKVEEPDRATLAWQKVLEIDATHDEAFRELEKLHTAGSRWEPLIELYLARLDTRTEVAERTELLRKIARVFEEELGDKNQALDALLNALGEDFHDRETAKYLERMAQATGRWGEVIQTANDWLKAQTESEQKIRLCLHLAKWYGDDLGHPEYAQPYYAQIVQLDPNNVGALRQMGQLYRKNANWQQLGATLTRALDVAVADVDRKEILNELGELLDTQMAQTDQAIGYFQRSLEVDALYLSPLENLERIYSTRAQNRELVDVLTRKVPAINAKVTTDANVLAADVATHKAAEVAATKLRIAGLYEQSLGDPQRAAVVYREVLDVDLASIPAMRGLARVYETLGQWQELVTVLEQELDAVTTERERIELLMHLAKLHEEHFLKPDIAAQRLEQVLDIDPNHEDAYFALERSYRKLRQWNDLIAAYERHISATNDRATKIELYAAIAQTYADEIEDNERAIDAYRNIVDLDDGNIEALDALAKLYDRTDDAAQSIEYMTRVAELTSDVRQRVEAFYRIGKALDEKLGDRVSAQERYEMALDLDPSHVATLAALRLLAMDNADYDKAARYLDQEQSYTPAPRQRAKLLVELGKVREEMLGDHASAILSFEAAHEADPENEDSAEPLVTEYIGTEDWARAEPLLDLLVRKAGKRDRAEQHELWNQLGLVSSNLHKDDKALKAYTSAHQLDLTDQVTIRGLAEVSFRLADWAGALTNFQKVLTSLAEDETEQRADVYYKLGCIKREQQQPKQAINNFEKALGVDSAHRPTLDALVNLYADLKDWKQVVAYKRQILDNVPEGDKRFAILVEIGDIWQDQDKNPQKSVEALEEARDLEPNNHPLLHKLLALYQQLENWPKMIDTISAIAEMEKDPVRKSKFLYTMAQLYRDKSDDPERAVELFNEALDLNVNLLEAFERINKILTAQKDWKSLERAFRKMLRRMSSAGTSNPDLEFTLWHTLGLIYRDRLHDVNSAIEAFKMATRYKPDEAVERQILAELYESTDQMEAAIGEHAIVLQKDPMRVDPYRSLYKLYLKQHEYDRAWCMCAALAFLRKADEEEQRFFEDYRPRGMIQVKSRLDNEQWVRFLFHKDENLFIGKIFEMVTPAAIEAKLAALQRAKQLPVLDRRFKQDPATSTVTFAKTFGWAAQVLGTPAPELYVRNDVTGALLAVPSKPVASIAGQSVLTGFTPQELTFIVGKHLSSYRGEHYIKNLFPTLTELKVVLFSAIKLILPDFNVPPELQQAVTVTAGELVKYMQPIQRDGLRLVVQKFVEDGASADLKRWMQAIELTACRAGLLLCADLEIAKKIIAAEAQLPGDLPAQEKLKELIVFSVSEQYFTLRKGLGIAVG